MRVRMKAQISGSRDGQDWPTPGNELVVSDDEGANLCAAGLATPIAEKNAKVEKAVIEDEEVESRKSGLTTENAPRRRGRPPGSKNQPKTGE